MKSAFSYFEKVNEDIRDKGLWKIERVLGSRQGAWVDVGEKHLLNMCSNNYLGLCGDKELIRAAERGLQDWGYGMSSVRFICGTLEIHKQLEHKVSEFLGTEDTILYSSCFDANGGIFETLLTSEDVIISDELNHASIIDGIRLCKAGRLRYANNSMQDLEIKLREADKSGARIKLIATDGVFSMDGIVANLKGICDLADKYDALVMVDDSHATGFMGKTGRGTPEYCGVEGRVDILTGTFGKALGGASGGFVSSLKTIVDLLRQRSRPYLFSNTLAPSITAASIEVLNMLIHSTQLRDKLEVSTAYFRSRMTALGFDIPDGIHPIVPVMLYDANLAQAFSGSLFKRNVLASGFFYPVVPEGKARIRVQISALHNDADLDYALDAFQGARDETTGIF